MCKETKKSKSRGAKALYSRMEHVTQAKKDKKTPKLLSSTAYFIFVILAFFCDFLSVQPFQDRILEEMSELDL